MTVAVILLTAREEQLLHQLIALHVIDTGHCTSWRAGGVVMCRVCHDHVTAESVV